MTIECMFALLSCGMATANSIGTLLLYLRYAGIFQGVVSLVLADGNGNITVSTPFPGKRGEE